MSAAPSLGPLLAALRQAGLVERPRPASETDATSPRIGIRMRDGTAEQDAVKARKARRMARKAKVPMAKARNRGLSTRLPPCGRRAGGTPALPAKTPDAKRTTLVPRPDRGSGQSLVEVERGLVEGDFYPGELAGFRDDFSPGDCCQGARPFCQIAEAYGLEGQEPCTVAWPEVVPP